jgi:hypothetical protein
MLNIIQLVLNVIAVAAAVVSVYFAIRSGKHSRKAEKSQMAVNDLETRYYQLVIEKEEEQRSNAIVTIKFRKGNRGNDFIDIENEGSIKATDLSLEFNDKTWALRDGKYKLPYLNPGDATSVGFSRFGNGALENEAIIKWKSGNSEEEYKLYIKPS